MSNLSKLLLRLVIIALFALAVSLLVWPAQRALPLHANLILFLTLLIILCAAYFGIQGVIIFGSISLLLELLYNLRISEAGFSSLGLLAITICSLYIYSFKERRFTQRADIQLENIEEEKNVLAVELEHARRENTSLKERLQRYTTLKGLTEALSSILSLDAVLSLITAEAFKIIGKSNACLLYVVDREKQELNLASSRLANHIQEVKLKKGDIFDSWVFKQRTRLMILDAKKDFRFNIEHNNTEARAVRSLIAAPLFGENKLIGILRLDNASAEAYDADDLRLLDVISDLASVAIENSLLYQQTENLARTDGLTGVFVHRYFQERFAEEISRAQWKNSPFAFLMIDIDNFKNYNDKYGHISGDIVLRQIAKAIELSIRPGDILARYGGEEFAVLLVETPRATALQIAEQIRGRIEKKKFIFRREVSEVRISIGISFFPENGEIKEELIDKADQALYKAKLSGKNKICTL